MNTKANGSPTRGIHSGIPSFFRGLCSQATAGGSVGYEVPGWHLANSIGNGTQSPCDIEDDEWELEVDLLKEHLAHGEEEEAWRWFTLHYPKCMSLVPARRRQQFVTGVRKAYEEERL